MGETIHFTSEGFNHLLFESNRKPRKLAEQFMKLKCLDHASDVVMNCACISETREFRRRIKGITKDCIAYELIQTVSINKTIRVVIEKIGNGKHKFKSVMPHKRGKQKNALYRRP